MCVEYVNISAATPRVQKRLLDTLNLHLQVVMTHAV